MPTHKHIKRWFMQAGLALGLFLTPAASMAQGMTFPSGMQESIASVTILLISAMNLLTWVFFIYLTILLDPEFIFNTQSGNGFEIVLNNIWMLARDLMNIAFALALIGAAVYTIVTAKKDFVAAHLKTFILAVILVNFSWFIPRVIIDVGNVAASAIYGVPSLLQTQGVAQQCRFTTNRDMRPNVSCEEVPPATPDGVTRYNCQCALLADAVFFTNEEEAKKLDGENWECVLGKTMCLKFTNLDVNTVAGHSAVLNGLIVNHARLQGLAGVSPEEKGGSEVGAMIQFMLRQVIVLVIHAALLFPLAAMAIAFAIRIPVLWITIAFMPFALLKFILPGNYGEYPQKIWDTFLKAAFLPAIVAVPLAIGFILVNAGAQMINAAPVLSRIGDVGFRITDGVSDLFELLWLGLTLGVLYTGVFMALEKAPFGTSISKFFGDMGKAVGGLALKLPLSLPVIPGPAGRTTPLNLLRTLDPRAVSYQLSRDPRGLPGVLEDMKKGGLGGAFETAAAAKPFANGENTRQLDDLNGKLEALTRALTANPANAQQQLQEFSRQVRELGIKINVDEKDPTKSLQTFADELKRQKADTVAVNTLNDRIRALGTAVSNANAPATPPPATPPPAAPQTPPPANP